MKKNFLIFVIAFILIFIVDMIVEHTLFAIIENMYSQTFLIACINGLMIFIILRIKNSLKW